MVLICDRGNISLCRGRGGEPGPNSSPAPLGRLGGGIESGLQAVPTTFVIDPEGVVRTARVGAG